MILSYTEFGFVWCIEENKGNGIVCCESEIQCRYFYGFKKSNWILKKNRNSLKENSYIDYYYHGSIEILIKLFEW